MAIIYTAKTKKDGVLYVYIGQTTRTLDERKIEHATDAFKQSKPDSFHQAIKKDPYSWTWTSEFLCGDSEASEKEKEIIDKYREAAKYDPNMIILNDTHNKKITKQNISYKPDYGIPRANKQKNYRPSEMGKKFAQESGKIKPVINIKTEKKYDSITKAESGERVSKATIKISCTAGKKLPDGAQYAYQDLDGNPILTQGHHQDLYIGKNPRKIKELISGIIYNNSIEVAEKYGLSRNSVSGFASGKYLIAKEKYIFCYLDENGIEIKTPQHETALQKINKQKQVNYIAWPVDFFYEEAEQQKLICYFKTLDELYKKLAIKNKSHIKAVCDGKRSHVEMRRIAYFDNEINKPILTARHLICSKKIIRKVQCLNDGNVFNNCTEAGSKYSVDANGIGLCAKGILKSVRVKNNDTGKTERFRFAYLDKSNNPILMAKHKEPLLQRRGVSKISLINQSPEIIERFGTGIFSSLAEYCKKTGVPPKRARRYLKNKGAVNLLGYEFIVLD